MTVFEAGVLGSVLILMTMGYSIKLVFENEPLDVVALVVFSVALGYFLKNGI